MNLRFLNIIALLGCASYLLGNVAYSLLDNPIGSASPYLFYIPMAFLMVALIWLAWEYSKKQTPVIRELWMFFLVLSVGQLIKFAISNPFVEAYNDYVWGFVATIRLLYKLLQTRRKHNETDRA